MTEKRNTSETTPPAGDVPSGPGIAAKLLTRGLWSLLLLAVLAVLAGKFFGVSQPFGPTTAPSDPKSGSSDKSPKFHAPSFKLTDQENKSFGSDDLRGKAYVCDFIFTTCGSACPMMTQKMAQLQKQTPTQLQLVSFTVNPEHDTPAVLKEYAGRYGADLNRWHFLTGTPEQMTQTVHDMMMGYQPATATEPILHSQKFLLVDGTGDVRGIYNSEDAEDMKKLASDATKLATSPGGGTSK